MNEGSGVPLPPDTARMSAASDVPRGEILAGVGRSEAIVLPQGRGVRAPGPRTGTTVIEQDFVTDEVLCTGDLADLIGTQDPAFAPDHWLAHIAPPNRERYRALHAEGLATGQPFTLDHGVILQDGTLVEVRNESYFLSGHDGRPRRMVSILRETARESKDRPDLWRQLGHEQARLRAILHQVPEGVIFAEAPSGTPMMVNGKLWDILGRDVSLNDIADFGQAKGFRRHGGAPIPAGEWPLVRSITTGEVVSDEEVEYERADGTLRTVSLNSGPVRDDEGRIVGGILMLSDVTRRRHAEAALRESEGRFRVLADTAPALIWLSDETGQTVFANKRYEDIFGRAADAMAGDGWKTLFEPEDIVVYERAFTAAFQERRPFRIETKVKDSTGKVTWFRVDAVPRFSADQTFLGFSGCAIDITESKQAELRHRLLINELNHRVKNTLATIQSVAAQTFKRDGDHQQSRELFEARIIALSKAHDVLTSENWQGADLVTVIREALAPFVSVDDDAFNISGPSLRVAPRIAISIAMALHELGTNALKYGSLSKNGGKVSVEWAAHGLEDATHLTLTWQESGGPPVEPPRRKGFGARLIERQLASELDGQARIDFLPTGTVCTLTARLPEFDEVHHNVVAA